MTWGFALSAVAAGRQGSELTISKRRHAFPKGVRRARFGPLPPLVVPRVERAILFVNAPATLPVGANWPAVREGSRSLCLAAPLDPCQDAAQHVSESLETSGLLACRHARKGRRWNVEALRQPVEGLRNGNE